MVQLSAIAQELNSDSTSIFYKNSDFVFIGKVKGFNAFQDDKTKIIADIDVVEIYKGRRWNKVMVVSANKNISVNKDYLFYGVWGKINQKGKIKNAGYFTLLHAANAEGDNALPEVKQIVKMLKQKIFGRIKTPRPKIILRKCSCSEEKL